MGNIDSTISTISKIIDGIGDIENMLSVLNSFMKNQMNSNNKVNNDAEEMKNRSNEMKRATEEQKNAIEEIVKSISSINEFTQINASGANEMADKMNEFSKMSENIRKKLSFFKV